MAKNELELRSTRSIGRLVRKTLKPIGIGAGVLAIVSGGILVGPSAYNSLEQYKQNQKAATAEDFEKTGGVNLIRMAGTNGVIISRRSSGTDLTQEQFIEAAIRKIRVEDGCDVGGIVQIPQFANSNATVKYAMTEVNCRQ